VIVNFYGVGSVPKFQFVFSPISYFGVKIVNDFPSLFALAQFMATADCLIQFEATVDAAVAHTATLSTYKIRRNHINSLWQTVKAAAPNALWLQARAPQTPNP